MLPSACRAASCMQLSCAISNAACNACIKVPADMKLTDSIPKFCRPYLLVRSGFIVIRH